MRTLIVYAMGPPNIRHRQENSAQIATNSKIASKELCSLYLQYQQSNNLAGAFTQKHCGDQIGSLSK